MHKAPAVLRLPTASGSGSAPQPPDPLAALRQLATPALDDPAFFAWLLGSAAAARTPPAERERQALQRLDRLLADAESGNGASLLPRSAAVVPRLLSRLRGETVSLPELSEQVSRDLTLVAEVVRMANSPCYRRGEPLVAIEPAIRVLGVDGLRQAIARAVLKPLIGSPGGRPAASAQRLWEHTDKKSQLCAALAQALALDPFEGYLLGLVHNAAWSAGLRAMDGVEGSTPWSTEPAFVAALGLRRDRLFGCIARQWQLTDGLTRVAADVARRGLAPDSPTPVLLLHAGHHLASRLCGAQRAAAGGSGLAPAADPLAGLPGPVRACYEALAQAPGAAD
ncbi:MAG TPA: HDOD domain-containing protein [Ideonella sp.]|nr:HDOD domain-containing protein [Ideonella sp.]